MPGFGNIDKWLAEFEQQLNAPAQDQELFQLMVDAPFADPTLFVPLGLGLSVLLLVDPDQQTMDRIALSDTEAAKGAVDYSVKAFRDIKIPLSTKDNIIIKAYETGQPQQTADWRDTFTPVLSAEEARFNQAGAGMASTVVYPLRSRTGGAFSFSLFKLLDEFGEEQDYFMKRYVKLVDQRLGRSLD